MHEHDHEADKCHVTRVTLCVTLTDTMSYTVTTLAGVFRWSFPVFDYERHDPAPRHVKELYRGWPHLPGGVFIGGQGRPKEIISQEQGAEVFSHATRVNTNDPDDMLTFVRKVGLLGCAEPRDAVQMFDSVLYTQDYLDKFQRLAKRVQKLKAESASQRRWTSLLKAIQKELHTTFVQPDFEMRTDKKGRTRPTQLWRPRCLKDVLFLTLWQVAQAEDYEPRQCLRCEGLFFVTTRNSRKQYCSKSCSGVARVNRYRQKQRAAARK